MLTLWLGNPRNTTWMSWVIAAHVEHYRNRNHVLLTVAPLTAEFPDSLPEGLEEFFLIRHMSGCNVSYKITTSSGAPMSVSEVLSLKKLLRPSLLSFACLGGTFRASSQQITTTDVPSMAPQALFARISPSVFLVESSNRRGTIPESRPSASGRSSRHPRQVPEYDHPSAFR